MKKRNLEATRRDFLKKSAILLGGAGISPLVGQTVLENLGRLFISVAEAQTAARPVDFYVDVAVRAAYCFGSLFPPRAFFNQLNNPQAASIFPMNQITAHQAAAGQTLFLSPGARTSGTNIGLENFASKIAFFECAEDMESNHISIWCSRMGGYKRGGDVDGIPPEAGASLAPLFAAEVARKRGANSPLIPGAIMSRGACTDSYSGGLPTSVALDSISVLSGFFRPRVPLMGRTELGLVTDALERINGLQEAGELKTRLLDVGNARLATQQGIRLSLADQVNVIQQDYTDLRTKFLVGQTIGGGLGGPMDFGESLLLAYIGFKNNLLGSTSIHLDVDHLHLQPEFGSQTAKDHVTYLSWRLGAFMDQLSKTPHPFRPGATLLDHTVLTMTSEDQRGVLFSNPDNSINWTENELFGAVLMGGPVRGGHYGDVYAGSSSSTTDRGTIGFDFNSGAPNANSKPNGSSIYRTMAELIGIPTAAIQAHMGSRYNTNVMNILKA